MASPFARAQMMMAAIAAAMSLTNLGQRNAAMAEIGPYQSRGKGRGKGAKVTVRPARSKYMPHTGAKEQERAARCYMVSTFPAGAPRSAPVLCQANKSFSTYPF
ncbi:hypothetical protein BX589_102346 [Paraburkholderia fungorum]|uniref:hypothetical protein n=1 Tax=Paraburkholderia fungorum TaxID=134537 RepID=UPI000D06D3FE|nr:hypothetical protein [Paraburkholderia fungorum]PRZ56145.1 hypothetical protein BX589_102346 [Paraburkholderia fungorum]